NTRRGLAGYARITARALFTYAPANYRIVGETTVEARAVLVSVANSAQYGNNARIAPRARVDDGKLDIVIVAETSRWRTMRFVPALFNGTVERVPGCTIMQVSRAHIESDHPIAYHVDGEPFVGGSTLNVRVHPGALFIASGTTPTARPTPR